MPVEDKQALKRVKEGKKEHEHQRGFLHRQQSKNPCQAKDCVEGECRFPGLLKFLASCGIEVSTWHVVAWDCIQHSTKDNHIDDDDGKHGTNKGPAGAMSSWQPAVLVRLVFRPARGCTDGNNAGGYLRVKWYLSN